MGSITHFPVNGLHGVGCSDDGGSCFFLPGYVYLCVRNRNQFVAYLPFIFSFIRASFTSRSRWVFDPVNFVSSDYSESRIVFSVFSNRILIPLKII